MSFDRNAFARAAWLAYTSRQRTADGKRLTADGYLLARAMLRRARKGTGQLWPSRCTLALDLGISEKTVERQHAVMRAFGLLTWRQRHGRRARRDTNLYALSLPRPAEKRRESICDSSRDKMSDGQALVRLAALCGASVGEVMPWLLAEARG